MPLFPLPDLSPLPDPPPVPTQPGTDFQDAFTDSDAAFTAAEAEGIAQEALASSSIADGVLSISELETLWLTIGSDWQGIQNDIDAIDLTDEIVASTANDQFILAGLQELATFQYGYALPDTIPSLTPSPTSGQNPFGDLPPCGPGYSVDPLSGFCVQNPPSSGGGSGGGGGGSGPGPLPCPPGFTQDPTSGNCYPSQNGPCPPGFSFDPISGDCYQSGGGVGGSKTGCSDPSDCLDTLTGECLPCAE